MAAGNSNFDEILSTTLKNYIPKLTDNIFSARPLFYALTNGQTIRRVSGGAKIVVPVIYGTNSTAASTAQTAQPPRMLEPILFRSRLRQAFLPLSIRGDSTRPQ